MNTRLITALLLSGLGLLTAGWAQVQPSAYAIDDFGPAERAFAAVGNELIRPIGGEHLTPVSQPSALRPGEFLLRRRFGPGEYGLFLGRRNGQGQQMLSAFRPPQGLSSLDLLEAKLYIRQAGNPNLDIANVYFDRECIYVENAVRLFFYNDGRWHILEMLAHQPSALCVTTAPAGAEVFIDGQLMGLSPLYDQTVFASSAIVCVKKRGYYSQDRCVVLEGRPMVETHLVLQPMVPPAYGVCIEADSYCAESRESLLQLQGRIAALKGAGDEGGPVQAAGDAVRPAIFRPRGEFEPSDSYYRSQARYLAGAAAGGEPKAATVERGGAAELKMLQAYRGELARRLYRYYFMPDGLRLERYDPDREFFPVSLRIDEARFHFSFSGTIAVPLSQAEDFKHHFTEGRLLLRYRSHILDDESAGEIRVVYSSVGMVVLYRGREYRLEGSYRFGAACADESAAGLDSCGAVGAGRGRS